MMIIGVKPKSGGTVKDFSSPEADTEITNDLDMNPDPDGTTLFISNKTEHTKMPNDDINESDSEKIVEVVNIESI